MRLLTRTEEFVLLAVWRLQEQAYSIPLGKLLTDMTSQKWSLGAVYMPLERLEKKELVTSFLSQGAEVRGGRPKRIYQLTNSGKRALLHVQAVEQKMWSGIAQLEVISS